MNSVISVVKNRRFDYKLLSEFIVKKQISLSEDYSKIKLTQHTLISGNCSNCSLETSKKFREIIKQDNLLCKLCTLKNAQNKRKDTCMKKYGFSTPSQSPEIKDRMKNAQNKRKDTCMKKYGVENPSQSPEIKVRMKDTCMKKYGVENPSQSPEIKQKKIDTCMKNHGVKYPGQSEEIKQRMKDTCIEKYGVENPSQSEEIKDKKIDTCMKNYGVENPIQCEQIKERMKDTCIERYGVSNPSQSEQIKQKKNDTCMKNYGVENPFQSPEIKEIMKDTSMKKYGVEYPMQNPEISEKSMLNSYNYKNYILPSGKIINYQGYENFAIEHFIKAGVSEENIIIDRISVPEVWYEYEGKIKRYYVDIFIPDQNLCVEVKSTYTLGAKKNQVLIKHEAVKALGYLCEIWVYDNKGNRLEIIS
jgi:hypothetical protein